MCLISIPIYVGLWKSLVKFGIKKSHEMISYILVGMTLLRKWIHGSPTKPCKLTHMTLDELYNKSYEGFMLSLCQENASIGLKSYLELYQDTALTKVNVWLRLELWGLALNKSCSFPSVEETLFKGQEPNQHANSSNRGSKFESAAVFQPWEIVLSP